MILATSQLLHDRERACTRSGDLSVEPSGKLCEILPEDILSEEIMSEKIMSEELTK